VHVCVRSRRRLRRLLVLLVANAVVLSIFGTVQNLLGKDIFFGFQRAPHDAFFATFVYHNHWGSFAVLMLCAALGLTFHHASRPRGRSFWQSPAPAGIVAALLIAATTPLSSSRSTTLLTGGILAVAALHGMIRIARARSAESRPWAGLGVAFLLLFVAFGFGVYKLAERTIDRRVETTRLQVADILAQGHVGQRAQLYRDTWRMAADRPWFGWGLESYERIFPRYNSVPFSRVDGLPILFQEAHSDWLQAMAEIGLVGGALLLAAILIPLARTRGAWRRHALPRYLLLGCASVALYAWIEFPMANPAVVATWWVLFFGGLRHALLSEQR
jgi:O-antigen ligase